MKFCSYPTPQLHEYEQVRVGNDIIETSSQVDTPLTVNNLCGVMNGKTSKSVCCNHHGRFVTIQAKGPNSYWNWRTHYPLEVGYFVVKAATSKCPKEFEENLCSTYGGTGGFQESDYSDIRNDMECYPSTTTTTTSTTTTSTTTTSTTTTSTTTTTPVNPFNEPAPLWKLVRHVPEGTTWHLATDQLGGTDVYGDPNDLSQAFSIDWSSEEYTEVKNLKHCLLNFSFSVFVCFWRFCSLDNH